MIEFKLTYASSDAFDPAAELSISDATSLFVAAAFGQGNIASIRADSAAAGHPAANVLDGDPDTIWHTPWGAVEPGHPHHLILDLGEPREIQGLNLLPRQDSRNGRIAEVAIYISEDGQTWGEPIHQQRLANTREVQQVRFTPVPTRDLKIESRSEVTGQAYASLAELEIIDTPSR